MKRYFLALVALVALVALGHATAADYHAGNLLITGAHARATVPGQTSGASLCRP